MTAENNGTDAAPEGDDPFAYLYRQEGGDGSTAQQYANAPRRSYNQVRAVGERQYGERPQPNAHYAAPETMPGGRAAARQNGHGAPPPPNGGHGGHGSNGRRGGGRNHNGLLIGAIAVVAAVVVGIGAAVVFNSDGKADDKADAKPGASAGPSQKKQGAKGEGQKTPQGLPKENAAKLQLAGGPTTTNQVPGAKSPGGNYVTGFNTPGASATWSVNVDKPGKYRLYAQYGVPGKDMHLSLAVNGRPHQTGVSMKNYAGAPEGDWAKGWQNTWSLVDLDKGTNTLKMSCESGDQCDVNLDQVWLTTDPP